jgi:glycosyltransferase involved in cell wall biosynthesis
MNRTITFCIPSKSNLRYLKACIASIIENSYHKNQIIIYVDEDKDGTIEWLKSLTNPNIKYIENTSGILKGIGEGYNICVENSTTDLCFMFHADMMLGHYADYYLSEEVLKHVHAVVCATRIEPPLHPSGPEKIIQNFGMWPEENIQDGFKREEFNVFVKSNINENTPKVTDGLFAPWMIRRKDFLSMGGHDKIFHSYHEDSDIFNRFLLNNYTIKQSWNAMVYHLTCRAGIFENGITTRSQRVVEMQNRSFVEFIRKWGSVILHDELMKPIVTPKYDVGFVVTNSNIPIIETLEPWCSTLYCDYNNIQSVLNKLQPKSSFDMTNRIKPISNEKTNDIIISFDGNLLNNTNFNYLMNTPKILMDSGELGMMEYDIFTYDIKTLNRTEIALVDVNNTFYKSKLIS